MNMKGRNIVHFLGIGGIGMSAIARWFAMEGYVVSGYDRTPSVITDALQSEGISISFEDSIATIPSGSFGGPIQGADRMDAGYACRKCSIEFLQK